MEQQQFDIKPKALIYTEEELEIESPLRRSKKRQKRLEKELDQIIKTMINILNIDIMPHLSKKHGIRVSWDDDYLYQKQSKWEDQWNVVLWSQKDKDKPQIIKFWYDFDPNENDYKQCFLCSQLKELYGNGGPVQGGLNELDYQRVERIRDIIKEKSKQVKPRKDKNQK